MRLVAVVCNFIEDFSTIKYLVLYTLVVIYKSSDTYEHYTIIFITAFAKKQCLVPKNNHLTQFFRCNRRNAISVNSFYQVIILLCIYRHTFVCASACHTVSLICVYVWGIFFSSRFIIIFFWRQILIRLFWIILDKNMSQTIILLWIYIMYVCPYMCTDWFDTKK